MRRYGIFSVTGYVSPIEGGNGKPPTVWYVTDDAACGEVVFTSRSEWDAKKEAFRLNAEERRWEKEQERTALAREMTASAGSLRNGR